MSSTHHHLLLDFFWQVISGPPCITKMLLHSLGLVLQIYEGRDDQLNRPGPMA
jgi:hypothetical protein